MRRIKADNWSKHKFKEIGRGGEAVIYQMKDDTVAKIFLRPEAPEYRGNTQLKEAAKARIKEMQKKLLAFPKNLPPQIVAPNGILLDGQNKVFGYTMPFIKGESLDKLTATDQKKKPEWQVAFLGALYDLFSYAHSRNIILGDAKEENIIVAEDLPYIIDTDGIQFGQYLCRTFTPRFVAPELIKMIRPKGSGIIQPAKPVPPKKTAKRKTSAKAPAKPRRITRQEIRGVAVVEPPQYVMVAPHSELTDWYSYLVLAMRLITLTDPFGGVVRDQNMDLGERIEKRLTVFQPEVIYPLVARPLRSLPRPILEVFYRVFHLGQRFIPDKKVFEALLAPSAPKIQIQNPTKGEEPCQTIAKPTRKRRTTSGPKKLKVRLVRL